MVNSSEFHSTVACDIFHIFNRKKKLQKKTEQYKHRKVNFEASDEGKNGDNNNFLNFILVRAGHLAAGL